MMLTTRYRLNEHVAFVQGTRRELASLHKLRRGRTGFLLANMACNFTQRVEEIQGLKISSGRKSLAISALESATLHQQIEKATSRLKVIEIDPTLTSHEDHLVSRYNLFLQRMQEIEEYEGGLANFALGEHLCVTMSLTSMWEYAG
ncbi:hypothetical protein O6H91_Y215600 [Diphasiastrum complanatum]|nr:hypothetical protein O6H91_Y215600 [Diphasiastrum complanatum]